MTVKYVDAVQEQLATSDTTVYTAPATAKSAHIIFGNCCNTSGTNYTVTVNVVQNGASASTSNIYVSAKTVTAGDSDPLTEIVGTVLAPGDFISAKSSGASALNFKVGVKEIY